jgi:hypothetical protein
MFCQVSPAETDAQESLCSLQFASRVWTATPAAVALAPIDAARCVKVGKVELGEAKRNTQNGELSKIRAQVLRRCRCRLGLMAIRRAAFQG